MEHYGQVDASSTLYVYFTTHDTDGAAVAPLSAFESADVRIYKNGSDVQRTSANGLTMTSPFDSLTGLHLLAVDLSDNTDSGFYSAGGQYSIVLSPDETVDGFAVIRVLADFRIGPVSANVTQNAGTGITAAAGIQEVKVASIANDAITAAAIATDAVTEIQSGLATAANLATVAGYIDTEVASILAAVDTEVAAIKVKTDFLPSATAGAAGGVFIAGTNAPVTITGSGDALTLTSTGANGSGLKATGNGGGNGIYGTGGATGNGASFWGGATFGVGLDLVGQTDSYALSATGFGSGGGVFISGGNGGGAAPGIRIDGGGASGDGIDITTTDGHAVSLTATGTSKHGLIVTGGTGGTSDGIKAVSGTGGVPIRGDLTGNITGNLSGSVGSVATGGIAAASFAAGAITATVIATGAIDADALATDAVDEIQAGLASDQIDDLIQATASPPGLQFTAEALELAPASGGSGDCPTVEEIRIEMDANSTKLADILTDTAEIGAAGAGLTALASQTSVNDLPTNAELATALAAADDAVLAALSVGVDANVVAIDGSTDAVARMQRALETEVLVTVDSGSTTTEIIADTIAPAGIDPDQFKGRVILFPLNTTTAALRGQGGVIEAYDDGTNTLTLESQLTTAPVAGDILIIV